MKSWQAKLKEPKQPKRVLLESDFAGIKAGTLLYVGTPAVVDAYIRKIPKGKTKTIERMRRDLADRNDCQATCPVSTSIFIRMSAEAAIEQLNEGVAIDKVSPFWRLIEPDSKIAKRLSVDKHWIEAQRSQEGT